MADVTVESLMINVKSSSTSAEKSINSLTKSLDKVNQAFTKTAKSSTSYINLWAKIRLAWGTVSRVADFLGGAIAKSNEYIENVNLFTVSMGKFANEAMEYAETVSDIMGIDPSEWIRNQGIFMTLATGFGVASDNAYKMSKNLTQLGYDMSSFFNISYQDAMTKLQSALAGELEPVRRVGYDLSQAALKQIALDADNYTASMEELANAMSDEAMAAYAAANGINLNYNEMTQAEKSQLRYIALMKQNTVVQGDMARTLNAPANQLRILRAQLTMASRAIGNIFIPALNAILPYAIAAVKVFTMLANTIASLFGYSGDMFQVTGLDDASENSQELADGLEESQKEAKKLKNYLMGIDELNILPSGLGSAEEQGEGRLDINLPDYDFLKGVVESRVTELVDKMKEWLGLGGDINTWADLFDTKLGKILKTVGLIGAGFGAWKIGTGLTGAVGTLVDKFTALSSVFGTGGAVSKILPAFSKVGAVVGAVVAIVGVLIGAFKHLWENNDEFRTHITNTWNKIKEIFSNFEKNIIQRLNEWGFDFESFADIIKTVWDYFTQILAPVFEAVFDQIANGLQFITDGIVALVDIIGGLLTNDEEQMLRGFEELGSAFVNLFAGMFNIAKNTMEAIFQTIMGWCGQTKSSLGDFFVMLGKFLGNIVVDVVNRIIELLLQDINSIISGINDLVNKVGGIFGQDWGWNFEPLHFAFRHFAQGGFPAQGEVFIAREAGAEMVGNIGNRTAVANNDQIVAGISEGVRNANTNVVNAIVTLINAVNSKDLSVSIGDETIARSAARGNANYYRMTGKPLIV